MIVARIGGLLAGIALIALAVVALRAEQTRSMVRLIRLESKWVSLRRGDWAIQASIARLRSPERIHRYYEESFPGHLEPPSGHPMLDFTPRLVDRYPQENR